MRNGIDDAWRRRSNTALAGALLGAVACGPAADSSDGSLPGAATQAAASDRVGRQEGSRWTTSSSSG
jgi:hypothetical protein